MVYDLGGDGTHNNSLKAFYHWTSELVRIKIGSKTRCINSDTHRLMDYWCTSGGQQKRMTPCLALILFTSDGANGIWTTIFWLFLLASLQLAFIFCSSALVVRPHELSSFLGVFSHPLPFSSFYGCFQFFLLSHFSQLLIAGFLWPADAT